MGKFLLFLVLFSLAVFYGVMFGYSIIALNSWLWADLLEKIKRISLIILSLPIAIILSNLATSVLFFEDQ